MVKIFVIFMIIVKFLIIFKVEHTEKVTGEIDDVLFYDLPRIFKRIILTFYLIVGIIRTVY